MPALDSNKPTVLLVDDDVAVLTLCRTLLEQEGFSVLVATGSSVALKICKNYPGSIDVLVTDLVLPPSEFSFSSDNEFPHVHGHQLAVRALGMRKTLRIILMSGNVDRVLADYGIRRGSVPLLSKPFESQILIALVRSTLQERPATQESLVKEPAARANGPDAWFG